MQISVIINVARSTSEAQRQAEGENLTSAEAIYDIQKK